MREKKNKVNWNDIVDKPEISSDWDDVQNKPSSFPSDWEDVANKPSSFGLEVGDVLNTYRNPGEKYLACDGSVYLQSAYSDLFSSIGLIGDNYAWSSGGNNIYGHTSRNVFALCKHNDLIIAGGSQGYLRTSDTGKGGWTARSSQFGTTHINRIASNGEVVIVVGDSGKISTSSDGLSYTIRTSGTGGAIHDVFYANSTWYCFGRFQGYIKSVDDGLNWEYVALSGNWWSTRPSTIVAFDKIYRFYGNFLKTADLDMSNISSEINLSSLVTISNIPHRCYFDGTTLVIVYNGGQIIKTTDGVNFSSIGNNPFTSTIVRTVTKFGGFWIITNNNGAYSISSDLVNWTPISYTGFITAHDSLNAGNEVIVGGIQGNIRWIDSFNGYDGNTSFQVPNLTANDFIKAEN